jgi:hypothetical protein
MLVHVLIRRLPQRRNVAISMSRSLLEPLHAIRNRSESSVLSWGARVPPGRLPRRAVGGLGAQAPSDLFKPLEEMVRVLRGLATTTSIPRESRNRLIQGECIPASMTTKAPGYALASFASSLRSLRIEPLFTISPRVLSTQNVCLLSPRSRPMVACAFRSLGVVFSIRHRAYYPRTAASEGALCLLI